MKTLQLNVKRPPRPSGTIRLDLNDKDVQIIDKPFKLIADYSLLNGRK